jgi:ABC-type Co2+ transport system permease subunit
MTLRGKRFLILESNYMVAYAIQRVLEGEGAIAHVGPSVVAVGFDGVIVDWGWARSPLAKSLSQAGVPVLAYTSDPVAIQRRLPGCRVLFKPATDPALLHAIVDLLHPSE